MESNTILIILTAAAIIGGLFWVLKKEKPAEEPKHDSPKSTGLQLQAYERLILLTDRIAIPNLVNRTSAEGLNAREMQFVLTKTIRDEFDHNITQQIYVSAEVWTAVKNLKEKNLLFINQAAATLPANATGMDLSRRLLEQLVTDKLAELPELVSQALSYEAKKFF